MRQFICFSMYLHGKKTHPHNLG